jgi:Tol biopolymer transport system component
MDMRKRRLIFVFVLSWLAAGCGAFEAPPALPTATFDFRATSPPSQTPTPPERPTSSATRVPPAPQTSTPLVQRGRPRLIFQRSDQSLWADALDGSEPWALSEPLLGPTDGVNWSLSPDERWIALVKFSDWRSDSAAGELALLDPLSGEERTLVPALLPTGLGWRELATDADRAALVENTPAWSPDGGKLAFVSAHEGQADLYAYDLEAGSFERLASEDGNAAWPSWSPDGKYLLFYTVTSFGTGAGPYGANLWSVSVDEQGPPQRLGETDVGERIIAWFDARRVLSQSRNLGMLAPGDVRLIDVRSGEARTVFKGPADRLAWSPAAGLLAVSALEASPSRDAGLYLVNPLVPKPDLVAISDSPVQANWSPDGRFLIYLVGENCFIYDRTADEREPRDRAWCSSAWSPTGDYLLSVGEQVSLIDFQSGEVQVLLAEPSRSPEWSPDGHWATWLVEETASRFALWAASPQGRPFQIATGLGFGLAMAWTGNVPPLSDWPVFRHEGLGFELQYPPGWKVESDPAYVWFNDPLDPVKQAFNVASASYDPPMLAPEDFLQHLQAPLLSSESITVDGFPALRVQVEPVPDMAGFNTVIAVIRPGEKNLIIGSRGDPAVLDMVLPTIRFFEPQAP